MLSTDLRQNHVGVGTRIVGVVQGYRPQVDWGGDSGSATIVVGGHNVRVATSGWRRRCLYLLLVALLALSIINLSLTLWILKTVNFNLDGMGHLNVVIGGVKMQGISRMLGKVSINRIMSRKDQDLNINCYHNFTILTAPTRDDHPEPYVSDPSYLHINPDDVEAGAQKFLVHGIQGGVLFESSPNRTIVGAKKFTVTGSEGASFQGSIQTPHVYSRGVHRFSLESVTRRLEATAAQEIRVEARDGDISVTSLKQASLVAEKGAIRFDNPKIFMPKLPIHGNLSMVNTTREEVMAAPTVTPPETQIPPPEPPRTPTTPMPPIPQQPPTATPVQVYQVCVCPSGRLFVVTAASACVPDDEVCR
ncbi:delta-sarcoglycan-like [Homarus americanus]|uniref:delta-sarcoglycan-like n=1 Tax=Homarus americanus TaxID=6706 RepID=UPI001C47A095|nr:delta-sarcoglycan-like [Homarus americanus]